MDYFQTPVEIGSGIPLGWSAQDFSLTTVLSLALVRIVNCCGIKKSTHLIRVIRAIRLIRDSDSIFLHNRYLFRIQVVQRVYYLINLFFKRRGVRIWICAFFSENLINKVNNWYLLLC